MGLGVDACVGKWSGGWASGLLLPQMKVPQNLRNPFFFFFKSKKESIIEDPHILSKSQRVLPLTMGGFSPPYL